MRPLKFLTLGLVITLLSGCLTNSNKGTVIIDQKPYEISLILNDGVVFNEGYQVTINGEDIGVLVANSRSSKLVTFDPIKTKYGTLTAEYVSNYHIIDSDMNFRFFLDSEYIGTVKV